MDHYFSPLACSLATRIALYEAGADAGFIEVDPKTKRIVDDGSDYLKVYPLGMVPAIRMDDGALLTENAAILQYVAERFPDANLAPKSGIERARLQQWLCFIGTELHKALFAPLLDAKSPEGAKAYALEFSGFDRSYMLGQIAQSQAQTGDITASRARYVRRWTGHDWRRQRRTSDSPDTPWSPAASPPSRLSSRSAASR